jgi:hypothetical protein
MSILLVHRPKRWPLLAVALCLGLATLGGCARQRATVTGKVIFMNKPLTAGTVSFVAGPNLVGTGRINADGTYTVNDAPVGDVTVTVETPKMGIGPMAGMPKPPPGVQGMPAEMQPQGGGDSLKPVRVVPAPEQYKTAESSPLKYTVKPGNQTYDIPLTP